MKKRIQEITVVYSRYGYRRIHTFLQREGWTINHKRVYRLYCAQDLQMRRKPPRRKVSAQIRGDRTPAAYKNQCWSMDFLSDQLFDGSRFRILAIVDNYTRESVGIRAKKWFKGHDVAAYLEELERDHGTPEAIRVDNGPEFTSKDLDLWAYANKVK